MRTTKLLFASRPVGQPASQPASQPARQWPKPALTNWTAQFVYRIKRIYRPTGGPAALHVNFGLELEANRVNLLLSKFDGRSGLSSDSLFWESMVLKQASVAHAHRSQTEAAGAAAELPVRARQSNGPV